MTVTYRELFHTVNRIRKTYSIPTNISHASVSDKLSKADEAFWDFKCENNLDFPLRYSEVHRLLSVAKGKKPIALLNMHHNTFEEHGLVGILVEKNLVYRKWVGKDITLVHNYVSADSIRCAGILGSLKDKHEHGFIDRLCTNVIRDWIIGVPLSSIFILVQSNSDFSEKYDNKVQNLVATVYKSIKMIDKTRAIAFKKDVMEKYYGSESKIHGNAKTRSSKITQRS
jgi:hypothetical protein